MAVAGKEIFKKVRRIEIRTRRLVNDLFSGEYHSTFKGRGMEFEEVREYTPGDDIRLIDWNVTARTGLPHVKKFREERELTVILLVDASSSGRFGTHEKYKEELAAELCALLAFSAIKNNDKVGLIIFTDAVEKYIPPQKGKAHVLRIIREILNFKPERQKTDIAGALEFFSKVTKRRSVVFLISDFMSEDYFRPLRIANKKHDLIALRISDPREFEFGNYGLMELEDAETGEVMVIDTSSREFRTLFAHQAEESSDRLKRMLRLIDLDFIQIRNDRSYIVPLIQFFKMREKRR
jgi:uncharacterized protein (DUF58 family)